MCLPDYVDGLILIESLGDEAAQGTARSPDNSAYRKLRTIYRRQEKIFPTGLIGADNLVPAGA
jgi:hypothetical protein